MDTATNPFSPSTYGVYVEGYGKAAAYDNYGVYGSVFNLSDTYTGQYGLYGFAYGGQKSVGVTGIAGKGGVDSHGGAFGAEFSSTYPNISGNIGIHATAANSSLLNLAGLFDGDVLINAGSGTYALTVNGSSWQSAGTAWATSDKKFKKNILQLEDVTEKIKKLNGYTYSFKTEDFPDRHFDKAQHIGFIAQELKEVFPQLVMTDPNGDLAVDYQGMIPVLLESIKSQQKQIDAQQELINQILQKSGAATGLGNNSIGLAGYDMEQNEPNPFTHETLIRYTIPATVNTANMNVYDLTGKQIASFPITQKGASSVTITSEKLAPGIYIYTIIADGKAIDSKRMIVSDK